MYEDVVRTSALAIYRHIGAGSVGTSRTTAEGTLPLRSDLRGPNGPFASAVAVFLQDIAGCNVFPIAPMVAPVQIDVHVRDGADGASELVGTSEVVRAGRTLIVTQARVHRADEHERLVAFGQITFATMGSTREQPGDPHRTRSTVPEGPVTSLFEWLGARPRSDGRGVDLEKLPPELVEPVTLGGTDSPSLHGGPLQILTETAAWHVASQRADRERLRIADFSTAMMASSRVAPFAAVGEVLSERAESIDCRVELREDGGQGRVTAVSYARFECSST
jgi:acyl-coenzyme A thioesterase PaaI-like protein